jgi:hypothetical protein
MDRLRRILRDLFHQAIRGRRRVAPLLTATFGIASDSERLERRSLWGWSAATHEAHARGLRLLEENLSPAQRDQYERYGYFDVAGGETGRRYRIKNWLQANVEQLDKSGRSVRLLCFMPEGGLVIGDVMLAQKLALELFEADALRVANQFCPNPYQFGPMP